MPAYVESVSSRNSFTGTTKKLAKKVDEELRKKTLILMRTLSS